MNIRWASVGSIILPLTILPALYFADEGVGEAMDGTISDNHVETADGSASGVDVESCADVIVDERDEHPVSAGEDPVAMNAMRAADRVVGSEAGKDGGAGRGEMGHREIGYIRIGYGGMVDDEMSDGETGYVERKEWTSDDAAGTALNLCVAKILTTLTHEIGHAEEALGQHLTAEIHIGAGPSKGALGAAGNVGAFEYKGEAGDEGKIYLAGIGRNLDLYKDLNREIREGRCDTRFGNAMALLTGLELARYAAWDLASGRRISDLEMYTKVTDVRREFIYGAAVVSAAEFFLNGGAYHAKRAFGMDAEYEEWDGFRGTGIKPGVWVYGGRINAGLQLSKDF